MEHLWKRCTYNEPKGHKQTGPEVKLKLVKDVLSGKLKCLLGSRRVSTIFHYQHRVLVRSVASVAHRGPPCHSAEICGSHFKHLQTFPSHSKIFQAHPIQTVSNPIQPFRNPVRCEQCAYLRCPQVHSCGHTLTKITRMMHRRVVHRGIQMTCWAQ